METIPQPPGECSRLSFADFGGPRRPYTAPALADDLPNKNTPDVTSRGHYQNVERETGFEPATLSLGSRSKRKQ